MSPHCATISYIHDAPWLTCNPEHMLQPWQKVLLLSRDHEMHVAYSHPIPYDKKKKKQLEN